MSTYAHHVPNYMTVFSVLCIAMCVYLVVCVELLVLSLTLTEGLPLCLQCLRQVGVFQALLRILL